MHLIRKLNFNVIILVVIVFSIVFSVTVLSLQNPDEVDIEVLRTEFERIYNLRSDCLVSGEIAPLNNLFDTSQKYGIYSLDHEIRRVMYLKDWSTQRRIKFKDIESYVRIKKVLTQGKIIKVMLEESYRFDYVYEDDPGNVLNSFGVGIRHTAKLTNKEDKWLIYQDWYTDCFEDALQSYTAEAETAFSKFNFNLPIESSLISINSFNSAKGKNAYNRENAVIYADKYCGAAWGSTNNFKYNPKYMDYNGAGGDCTNFASQVLGDEEAGGLNQDGTWFCSFPKYGRSSGSSAWVNADSLKNYLIYSGKANVIMSGSYKQLTTQSTDDSSSMPISKLCLGDIICYEKGSGNIDHFAVVTAFDSKGYPLVNSHTIDRYHVPWDLGWGDKRIRFFLVHIN